MTAQHPFPARIAPGTKATVMGLGRFGGGAAVTRWLVQQGATVLLTDLEPAAALAEPLQPLQDLISDGRVTLRLGGHNPADFTTADLVVANPAVPKPWNNPFLTAAIAAGVPVTTEIRLLVERLPDRRRVVAITGSVGKSTTSAMIHHALCATGFTSHFGGNIGGSLLPTLPSISPSHTVVLELSSAMLHWLSQGTGHPSAPGWSPGLAVVTNIAANHIDWHASFDHYSHSKAHILRHQQPPDAAILHHSLANWATDAGHQSRRFVHDAESASLPPLAIPGSHNRSNAAIALAALEALGVPRSAAARALATFPGLPDRLQFLGHFPLPSGGTIRAYNDSKSTTPEAAALAIQAFDDDPHTTASRLHIILGGYDKHADLAPMIAPAARCKAAYCVGATGPHIHDQLAAAGAQPTLAGDVASAVAAACQRLSPGDVLLLSPGCASWDQFVNYEARGRLFAEHLHARLGPPTDTTLSSGPKQNPL